MTPDSTASEGKGGRGYLGFVLLLLALPLFSATSLSAADATTDIVPLVTVSNLLAHAKEYNRKKVEVIGYYRTGSELSAIWDTKEEAGTLHTRAAIWVGGMKEGFSSNIAAHKDGMVRLIGVFRYYGGGGAGHRGLWDSEFLELELLENVK